MACETLPTSPSPAGSSGCRHQTAAHPGETQAEKTEKKLEIVKEKNALVLMTVLEQKIRLHPIKGSKGKKLYK